MSLMAYWLANLVFDTLKCAAPCGLIIWCLYLFEMEYDNVWQTILLFPIGVVPYSYALSFLFEDESTASTVILFSNIAAGSIGGMATFILRFIPDTMAYGDIAAWALKLFPTYTISHSIVFDASSETFETSRLGAQMAGYSVWYYDTEPYALHNIGGDLLALVMHFILGILVIINYELGAFKVFSIFSRWIGSFAKSEIEMEADVDVTAEEERVEKLQPEECLVRVNAFRQVYSSLF